MAIDIIGSSNQLSYYSGLVKPDTEQIVNDLVANKDKDGDGQLSSDEVTHLGSIFEEADEDGDRYLTEYELLTNLAARLNSDGIVTSTDGKTINVNLLKNALSILIDRDSDYNESTYSRISNLLVKLGISSKDTASILETLEKNKYSTLG